jgi:hypothetical protein
MNVAQRTYGLWSTGVQSRLLGALIVALLALGAAGGASTASAGARVERASAERVAHATPTACAERGTRLHSAGLPGVPLSTLEVERPSLADESERERGDASAECRERAAASPVARSETTPPAVVGGGVSLYTFLCVYRI